MRIVAGDFPAGTYAVEDGFLWQSLSNQIAINTTTVESVQYLDTVQERDAGQSYMKSADGAAKGFVAGGLGTTVGSNTADVQKNVARFIVYLRSGKVIHASGTLEEYDQVLRASKLAAGQKLPPPNTLTDITSAPSNRDRPRAQLNADKDTAAAEKEAAKAARQAEKAVAKADRRAERDAARAETAAIKAARRKE